MDSRGDYKLLLEKVVPYKLAPCPLVITKSFDFYHKRREASAASVRSRVTQAKDSVFGFMQTALSRVTPEYVTDSLTSFTSFISGETVGYPVRADITKAITSAAPADTDAYKKIIIELATTKVNRTKTYGDWIDTLLYFEELAYLSQINNRVSHSALTSTLYGAIDYIVLTLNKIEDFKQLIFKLTQEMKQLHLNYLEASRNGNLTEDTDVETLKILKQNALEAYLLSVRQLTILTKDVALFDLLKLHGYYKHLTDYPTQPRTDGQPYAINAFLPCLLQWGYFVTNYNALNFYKYNHGDDAAHFIEKATSEYLQQQKEFNDKQETQKLSAQLSAVQIQAIQLMMPSRSAGESVQTNAGDNHENAVEKTEIELLREKVEELNGLIQKLKSQGNENPATSIPSEQTTTTPSTTAKLFNGLNVDDNSNTTAIVSKATSPQVAVIKPDTTPVVLSELTSATTQTATSTTGAINQAQRRKARK